jgi:hypothetical protein
MKNTHLEKYETFSTSDLPLAAVFAMRFPLFEVGRDTTPRLTFRFTVTGDYLQLENEYRMGGLTVEPRKYFDQIKYLKSLLYT